MVGKPPEGEGDEAQRYGAWLGKLGCQLAAVADRFGTEFALSLGLDELGEWSALADERAKLEARWLANDLLKGLGEMLGG